MDHDAYNACLAAIVLLNPINYDLTATLLNRIPYHIHNDRTYILWFIGHNIHCNNAAFVEHVHKKIILTTLSQFNYDVTKYIIFVKDNLHMITSPGHTTQNEHNGLITYVYLTSTQR